MRVTYGSHPILNGSIPYGGLAVVFATVPSVWRQSNGTAEVVAIGPQQTIDQNGAILIDSLGYTVISPDYDFQQTPDTVWHEDNGL